MEISIIRMTQPPPPLYDLKYRVYSDNLHQELMCYRLVLGLLRFFKASI